MINILLFIFESLCFYFKIEKLNLQKARARVRSFVQLSVSTLKCCVDEKSNKKRNLKINIRTHKRKQHWKITDIILSNPDRKDC